MQPNELKSLTPWEQGYEAFFLDKLISDNPYTLEKPFTSKSRSEWLDGYIKAKQDWNENCTVGLNEQDYI
jgi:ribosome modulation factor